MFIPITDTADFQKDYEILKHYLLSNPTKLTKKQLIYYGNLVVRYNAFKGDKSLFEFAASEGSENDIDNHDASQYEEQVEDEISEEVEEEEGKYQILNKNDLKGSKIKFL